MNNKELYPLRKESKMWIKGPAMRHKVTSQVFALVEPKRHENVRAHIVEQMGPIKDWRIFVEGFVDRNGDFLDREQAMTRAQLTGQVRKGQHTSHPLRLNTPDLW